MKVLHVLNELKYSGAEIMYVDAAPVFQKLGCELMVLNTTKNLGEFSSSFENAGYEVIHRPYEFPKWDIIHKLKWQMSIIKLIKEENIGLIHIHAARLRGVMAFIAWRAGVKSVYTFHNVFRSSSSLNYIHQRLQRYILHKVFKCKMQTISNSVYDNELNYWKNQTSLIYNWYGKTRFFPATNIEREKHRKELNIKEDDFVIISVGGCSEVKRHTDIIKAIPLIKEHFPNLVYLHLGKGMSLDEEIRLVNNLNISENVRFLGNQRDVRKYLISSDVYVMPSKFEGIPITTIEAMACKIPCVLYNVPGLCDFNKEMECSKLIPESYEILAKTVCDLYSNLEDQQKITNNASRFVNKYFNVDVNAAKIFKLYS